MKYIIIALTSIALLSCGSNEPKAKNEKINTTQINSKDLARSKKLKENEDRLTYMSNIDSIKSLPIQISKFIPNGYLPLDTAIGDLNGDGTSDILLVLKNRYEDTLTPFNDSPQFKRPLLILLETADGNYILVKRNDNIIMCNNSSGAVASDPFTGLKIKDGYFSIEHGVAEGPQHWETVTTFKYDRDKKEWYLFKEGSISQTLNDDTDPNADAMKTYKKTKTRKDFGLVPFEKYDLNKK